MEQYTAPVAHWHSKPARSMSRCAVLYGCKSEPQPAVRQLAVAPRLARVKYPLMESAEAMKLDQRQG